jgi:hypothetical protein
MSYEIVEHNDQLYQVIRVVQVRHNPILEAWKEAHHCDTVLKKLGHYYFCRKIEEAQIIEETK